MFCKCKSRIAKLEEEVERLKNESSIKAYDKKQTASFVFGSLLYAREHSELKLADAVRQLALAVGYEFKYQAGTEKTVKLEKIATKKKA